MELAPLKIIYVSSEVYPFIKTGGLGDVAGSLPPALHAAGHDVAIMLPAYRDVLDKVGNAKALAHFLVPGGDVTLRQVYLPGTQVKVWLVDAPALFDRAGNPYMHPDGHPWPDNAQRFALLDRAVVTVARDRAGLAWRPDIVHCNDWQSGLIPPLLALEARRPATLFTIHNLAYQGLFSDAEFESLNLPDSLWSPDALEFHNRLSFLKGGLVYADRINTVSAHYAQEIQTPEFGRGLDGLLRHRSGALSAILNGIDEDEWNPGKDPHLVKHYGMDSLPDKALNKAALQRQRQLPEEAGIALLGMVDRLVEQKGIDLVLAALPKLVQMPLQMVILGTGEPHYERALHDWAERHPDRLSVTIGYDEALAHRIEGGVDIFLMPSRFEPCGLNQMYSLRYGTVPIVGRTGGLVDTVVDATPKNIASGTATGVLFSGDDGQSLLDAVNWATTLYRDKGIWTRMQREGMQQDFSWRRSAQQYIQLYELALQDRKAA